MTTKIYFEDFNHGPGGWLTWISNARGAGAIEIENGVAISRSPWWIDYNHAPPGAGYLHLPFCLFTGHDVDHGKWEHLSGPNRFIDNNCPTDFRNAKVTLRVKGDVQLRGAQLLFHCQAKVGSVYVNYVLTGQPFQLTPEWNEQTVTLHTDPGQWTCLGSRHDRTDYYGEGPVEKVLADVSDDIIFVLYPLNVVPIEPIMGDMHQLKAGDDYSVRREFLPQGAIMFDYVKIEWP